MANLQASRRDSHLIEQDLSERLPVYSETEAKVEASRCLYCFDAPCVIACPTSIDIPGFINRIATGDRSGAAQSIFSQNFLGATCARVCATEELCEGSCVLEPGEGAIEIGRLQRYATDLHYEVGGSIPYVAGTDTGSHVAIVGAGPAGLAAAAKLRTYGHAVTLYERMSKPGGLAAYGIIPLREPTEVALWESAEVERLGAQIRTGIEVGVDISVDQLVDDHDAVFLSTGAGRRVSTIDLKGATAAGVQDALAFIEDVRTVPVGEIPVGNNVVVVGAGNTAMDAATIAVRLGAGQVTCIYRRTEAEMTGYPSEYEHCLRDGVAFRWLTQPVAIETGKMGEVVGVTCAEVDLGTSGEDGRAVPIVSDRLFTIEADHVLLATGQKREPGIFDLFGLDVEDERPRIDESFMTSRDGVFAGGDNVLSGKELSVVDAVAQGRDAAVSINEWLLQRTSK